MLIAAMLLAIANAAQPYPYMEQLRAAEKTVDEAPEGPQRIRALHMLALAQSFVGESQRAQETNARRLQEMKPTPQQHSEITAQVAAMLADFEPRDALAAIVGQARNRRIVILNEAHQVSQHRAFATLLALELRKQGFGYLAVETLDARTPGRVAGLQRRGYPLAEDGFYSKEPLFGDFLRRSLAAGYKLVAYEHTAYSADYDELAPVDRQIQREEGQAQNIMDRVFVSDPHARIFIYVGHGHVNKGLTDFDGRMIALMAERLREKSGTEPLCIDQTAPARPALAEQHRLLLDSVMGAFYGDSIVMASKRDGTFWNPGQVDMQVWHRPATLRLGREHWLAMAGYRRPRAIPSKLLPREGRRLVQAFVAGESPDAVPVDQVLVTADGAPPVLMLPKGRYRFAYQD